MWPVIANRKLRVVSNFLNVVDLMSMAIQRLKKRGIAGTWKTIGVSEKESTHKQVTVLKSVA
jgi:hypothetical protein